MLHMQYGFYYTCYICSMDSTIHVTYTVWILLYMLHIQYGFYYTCYICSMDSTIHVTYAVWILLSDTCSQVWKGLSLPLPHLWPLCGSCWVSHVEFLVLVKCLLLSEWLVTKWGSSLVSGDSQILPSNCEMYKAVSIGGWALSLICVLSSCAAVRRYTDSTLSRAGFSAPSLLKQGG